MPRLGPLRLTARPGNCPKISPNKMALVLAYGILSKFVPDVLLRALADAGDVEPPPFPEKSAGAELMQNTFALYEACCALNYTPQRLQREWPRVSPEVFHLVSEFCNRQTGFGPLAWDSPGYEDPNYVVRLLHSAFDEVDAEQVRRRLSFAKRPAVARSTSDVPAKIAALRRVLGFWLDFLERETWYVRRAFYVGMVPLLQQLAAGYRQKIPAFQLADLLFLDIRELVAGIADPAMIHTRRHRYMENTELLVIARRRSEPAPNDAGNFMSAENSTRVHSGLGAAPGRASGKAYVIRDAEDIMAVPAGCILVLRVLHPHLAPLLPRVAGLVVEEGAILQHATTLARECGIPAAVGIRDARNLFQDGDLLDVDGYTGKVIEGHVD